MYLRPDANRLGPEWLGLASHNRSMLIDWTEQGFSARVIDSWLKKPVVGKLRPGGGRRLGGYFRNIDVIPNTQFFFALAVKNYRGDAKTSFSVSHDNELIVDVEGTDAAFGIVGPAQYYGLTQADAERLAQDHSAKARAAFSTRLALPPWTVGFISTGEPEELLKGFDPDPVLLARSTADTILYSAGLRDIPPAVRYEEASRELQSALLSLAKHNERALQAFLEARPWVLVPEADFESALPRPSLLVTERLANGTTQDHHLIPDFIYHLFDHQSLVVEIESATKRLLTQKEETTFRRPAAQATAAVFQIISYKLFFNGPLGAQMRAQLSKPDSWGFDYLLVVGSVLEPDFDERSWVALRDHLKASGITLRTWDFYLDRLRRLAAMADFKGT